jgi:hypothetical protein
MSDGERCLVTELLPRDCAHCRAAAAPRPAPRRPDDETGPWFHARYPGTCSRTGDHFDEGDLIRADGEGGWELSSDANR